MIYTLAAYSITVGVLALYGVVMQHRQRVAEAVGPRDGSRRESDPIGGFNLGAMLLAPIWMMAHGMRIGGVLLLGVCVVLWPIAQQDAWIALLFVGAIPLAAGTALGFLGNRIAAQHHEHHGSGHGLGHGPGRMETLSASQLPWALAGIALHVFVLPWAALLLLDR